jgi:hypothetical protein
VTERSTTVVQDYVFVPAVSVDAARATGSRSNSYIVVDARYTRMCRCGDPHAERCYGWNLRRAAEHLDLPVRLNSSDRDLFLVR